MAFPFEPGVRSRKAGLILITRPVGDTTRRDELRLTRVVIPKLLVVTVADVELPAVRLEGRNPPELMVNSGTTVTVKVML